MNATQLELRRRVLSARVRIGVSPRTVSDLELISNGAYAPLEGFLNFDDYRNVVAEMRLAGGAVWSLPITLAIDAATARAVRRDPIGLLDESGNPVALLEADEIYRYDKVAEAQQVFQTRDEKHPGVAQLLSQPEYLVGGRTHFIEPEEPQPFAQYRLTPAETRAEFRARGWERIVAFQTRNPIHRAHEYIQKCALEMVDGLFLHPLVGETKSDDLPAAVRMRCYEVLLRHYYPADRTLLGVFPAAMRYAGPREAVFHAVVRRNYGATHFIVGRDHAGVGNYYGTYDAQKIFARFRAEDLGITPLFFDHTFYCRRCAHMASDKTCTHGDQDRLALSGTRVRELLRAGLSLPPEFTRPEISDILMEEFQEAEAATA